MTWLCAGPGRIAPLSRGASLGHWEPKPSVCGTVATIASPQPPVAADVRRLKHSRLDLLFKEARAAYKNIEAVIHDLVDDGLVSVIATFRPLLTYKTRATRR